MELPSSIPPGAFEHIQRVERTRSLDRLPHYRALDSRLGRRVILRVPIDKLEPDNLQAVQQSFQRQIAIHEYFQLRRLSGHENPIDRIPIVALVDVQAHHTHPPPYLVTEDMPGIWLSTILDRAAPGKPPLTEREALLIASDVARAIAWHAQYGLAHLNIQPATVFVERASEGGPIIGARLDDYGCAFLPGGQVTPLSIDDLDSRYLPPEVDGSAKPVEFTYDLYAVGHLLWEMFTRTLYSDVRRLLPAADLPPDAPVTPATRAVLARALHQDPAQRFQSPQDLVVALDEALAQLTPRPEQPKQPKTSGPAPDRPRRSWPLPALFVLAVLVAIGWLSTSLIRAQARTPTPGPATALAVLPTFTAQPDRPPTASPTVLPSAVTPQPALLTPSPTATAGAIIAPMVSITPTPTLTLPIVQPDPPLGRGEMRAWHQWLRFDGLDVGDPRCVVIEVSGTPTVGWHLWAEDLKRYIAFDPTGRVELCELAERQVVQFTILNQHSGRVPGGADVASEGGALLRAIWK